ncbi:MAG: erythromycin esterase family protein [Chitinophagaceae bacterium]|nr:erythromycin esterase family protein [Chitinophagaceae bacterium]
MHYISIRKIALFLIIVCSNNLAYSQKDFKDYVINNITPLDLSDDADFNSFDNLGNAIGDSKIVMLGEQDHGDGSTFLVKAKLIKYLHEKKGFDVLAFESDFYSLNKAWSLVTAGQISLDSAILTSIYPVWTNCQQCDKVFKYVKTELNNKNPLILTGFDNQLVFKNVFKNLKTDIIGYLDTSDISFINSNYYKNNFSTDVDSLLKIFRFNKENKNSKIKFLNFFNDTLSTILFQLDSIKNYNMCYYKVIKNLISFSTELKYIYEGNQLMSDSIRDKQMAENLLWLAKYKYPEKKIIVWAANSHIIKNRFPDFNAKNKTSYSMGNIFTGFKEFSEKTYIIGFTGYSGSYGRATTEKVYKIPSPKSKSIEAWLHENNNSTCFIDFKKFTSLHPQFGEPFWMNGSNWQSYKSNWERAFDGIIYIDEILPCVKSKN